MTHCHATHLNPFPYIFFSSSSSWVKDWVIVKINPAALTCSRVSVVSGSIYIYFLRLVKTMYIDNLQSSSWTQGGKQ